MKLVDFHMHTTHSDGSYTPADLLRYCKEKKLSCVSVTDHDTMSSFDESESEAKKLGIELVPGIEISATFEPGTLHILGFFQDRNHPVFKQKVEEIQTARRERNPKIIQKLNAMGIDITIAEVEEEAFKGAGDIDDKQIGRPHFAKILLRKGYAKDMQDVFDKFLGKGKPAYIDKRRITAQESIELINNAGGIASIAHPKQMRISEEQFEIEFKKYKDYGLGAIEVYNSCQDRRENEFFMRIAKKFDLIPTGGSDFHGANKPDVDLGYMGDDVKLGYEMVDALREKIIKRGK